MSATSMGIAVVLAFATTLPSPHLPSTPDLGTQQARCQPAQTGPAFLVDVAGLKDREGLLKLEVYPANDRDFLADDNVLVNAGKVFRRVEQPVPHTGPVRLCVRLPAPGTYAVSLLHDRNRDQRFDWRIDGAGFAGNPRLGLGKPRASKASASAGGQPTIIRIVLNYRSGLGFRPLREGS